MENISQETNSCSVCVVNKFPTFYQAWWFITVFTWSCQWTSL